jgi:hypothetical protein
MNKPPMQRVNDPRRSISTPALEEYDQDDDSGLTAYERLLKSREIPLVKKKEKIKGECYQAYGEPPSATNGKRAVCERVTPGKVGACNTGLKNVTGFPPCCNADAAPSCIIPPKRTKPPPKPKTSRSRFGYSSTNVLLFIGALALIVLLYFMYTKKVYKPRDIFQRMSQFGRDIKSIRKI